MTSKINNRRNFLKLSGATALSIPFVSRAWASTLELNMLAWYGHGEPDIVGEFEAAKLKKTAPRLAKLTLAELKTAVRELAKRMLARLSPK